MPGAPASGRPFRRLPGGWAPRNQQLKRFDPGEHYLTKEKGMRFTRILVVLISMSSTALFAQVISPEPITLWSCRGNVVQDGTFLQPVGAVWQTAYGTPQISNPTVDGCGGTKGYASMWGNQGTGIGEGLTQAVTLTAGTAYTISFCGRYRPLVNEPILFPYVDLVIRASVGAPANNTCTGPNCTVIPIPNTTHVTSTSWVSFNGCFTPTKTYDHITLSASNASIATVGSNTISWGEFDNFCVRPVVAPVINGPSTTCVVPATYCVSPQQNVTWTASGAQIFDLGNGCVQVNAFTSATPTLTATTQTACPVTVTKAIRRCEQGNCCGDIAIQGALLNARASSLNSNAFTIDAALSGLPQVSRVEATVLSASRTFSPASCGTAGPIVASLPQNQPPTAGWNGPVVPLMNGSEIVWVAPGNSQLALPPAFSFDVALPPPPSSPKCGDIITICVEFRIESRVQTPTGSLCRNCKVVRCFSFKRSGGVQTAVTVGDPIKN
jgi:hypothetical protein